MNIYPFHDRILCSRFYSLKLEKESIFLQLLAGWLFPFMVKWGKIFPIYTE